MCFNHSVVVRWDGYASLHFPLTFLYYFPPFSHNQASFSQSYEPLGPTIGFPPSAWSLEELDWNLISTRSNYKNIPVPVYVSSKRIDEIRWSMGSNIQISVWPYAMFIQIHNFHPIKYYYGTRLSSLYTSSKCHCNFISNNSQQMPAETTRSFVKSNSKPTNEFSTPTSFLKDWKLRDSNAYRDNGGGVRERERLECL